MLRAIPGALAARAPRVPERGEGRGVQALPRPSLCSGRGTRCPRIGSFLLRVGPKHPPYCAARPGTGPVAGAPFSASRSQYGLYTPGIGMG